MLNHNPQYTKYVQPHWVCGNFLVIWSTDTPLASAKSLDEFLRAVDPDNGRPVLADLYGTTGLGEFDAEALLD